MVSAFIPRIKESTNRNGPRINGHSAGPLPPVILLYARMIMTAIYSMFCTGEVWNPVDLFKIDMPDHLKEQQLAKAIKQATRFLEKQGLSVA